MSDHNAIDAEKMAEYTTYAERVPLLHGTEQPPSYAELAVVALVDHIQVIEKRTRVLAAFKSQVDKSFDDLRLNAGPKQYVAVDDLLTFHNKALEAAVEAAK
ncbi:hypothetical protein E3_1980 [Rhodococcus phage E3]|uniref:hypothetical protein n=1 Tax=Rhodococcus phage E3 TaxID=1007869 RepID=UPI0002C6AE00|nr:hypothetical protein M176_gp210 [Rhodococcus phage E3]AEQ21118.1 hypothetical protein E3_1980 [Rhodococcus phage E3]